jgi:hypothetical protein
MRVNDALAVGALDCPAQVGQILDGGWKGLRKAVKVELLDGVRVVSLSSLVEVLFWWLGVIGW